MAKRNKTISQREKRPSKAILRSRDLPPEIRQCIDGRVIDLSTASQYWRKAIEAALPRIESLIGKPGADRYEFKHASLYEFFLEHLQQRIDSYRKREIVGMVR